MRLCGVKVALHKTRGRKRRNKQYIPFYSVALVGFARNGVVCGDFFSVVCFSLVFFKYIITNITLLICKMTTHHKACTLPAVHSSRSMPASRMFRLNSQCNRRLTCSPNRVDLSNQKRPAFYACANRDVFAGFFSSRRHNLPPKVKLRNNQTERNVYMWMQQ